MAEEKKEEKSEDTAQKPAEAPQTKAEVKAETTASSAAQAPAATPAQKKEAPLKKEKPSNCAGCNKSIKKKRWYYRNGKYYCTKRCWKTASKKEEKPKDAKTGTSA